MNKAIQHVTFHILASCVSILRICVEERRSLKLEAKRREAVDRAQSQVALLASQAANDKHLTSASVRAKKLVQLDEKAELLGLKPKGQPKRLDGVEARGGYFPVRAGGHAPENDSRRDPGLMMGGSGSFCNGQ